jgi:hypothetical protein
MPARGEHDRRNVGVVMGADEIVCLALGLAGLLGMAAILVTQ